MHNLKRYTAFFLIFFTLASTGLVSAWAVSPQEEEDYFLAKRAFDDGFFDIALKQFEEFSANYPHSENYSHAQLYIARSYYNLNKFHDALQQLEVLKKTAPKDLYAEVIYWTGEVYFQGKDYKVAQKYFEQVMTEYSQSNFAYYAEYSLAWCDFEQQRYENALAKFDKLAVSDPQQGLFQDVCLKAMECLFRLGRYDEVFKRADELLANPEKITRKGEVFYWRAESFYAQGKYEQAVDEYKRIIDMVPANQWRPYAQLGMGWSYLKLRRFSEALEVFAGFQGPGPNDTVTASIVYGKGRCLSELERYDEAISHYDRILETYRESQWYDDAFLWKAESLYKLGDYAAAIRVYEKALEIFPETKLTHELRYNLGWAYLKQGELDAALAEFKRIEEESSNESLVTGALCRMGDIYLEQASPRAALDIYDLVLKEHGQSLYADYAQFQIGVCLFELTDYDGAVLAFQSLLDNFPTTHLQNEARYQIAVAHFKRGDFNAAAQAFDLFLTQASESDFLDEALFYKATALYNSGSYVNALRVFKEVIDRYPDSDSAQMALYQIAWSYHHMGRDKDAEREFNEYLRLYPRTELAPDVVFWFGEREYRAAQYARARKYFERLISEYPESDIAQEGRYWIAWSFYQERNLQATIREFEQFIQDYPDSDLVADCLLRLGDIQLEMGFMDRAMEYYDKIISRYLGTKYQRLGYVRKAETLKFRGDIQNAIAMYKLAVGASKDDLSAQVQFKIAECYEEQENNDRAVESYLKVPYLYPDQTYWVVKAQLRCAKIFEDTKKWQDAKALYEKVSGRDIPEAKYAQERLSVISGSTQ